MKIKASVLQALLILGLLAVPALAQEQPQPQPAGAQPEQQPAAEQPQIQGDPQMASPEMITPQNTQVDMKADVNPDELASLFFTFWEHNAIKDARNSRGLVRPPTDDELRRAQEAGRQNLERPPPGLRELSLGGIVYASKDDWTIWLNGQRVTPDALPKEILDLRVHNEYIEVKWIDEYTAQIFPVKLRAHQRFNLDSRIFLPG